ncbi:hypothetical protein [Aquitalea sp. ASV15]|uniref:hypothetical protein n=1 Tax=Aquitalea sp. ASV15 TaxID=2795104 RepID=UPI0018ED2D34|nr:hypothetical protein [Aquitalea sp. ASV15]
MAATGQELTFDGHAAKQSLIQTVICREILPKNYNNLIGYGKCQSMPFFQVSTRAFFLFLFLLQLQYSFQYFPM